MKGKRGKEQHTRNTREIRHGYRDDICNNQEMEAEAGQTGKDGSSAGITNVKY